MPHAVAMSERRRIIRPTMEKGSVVAVKQQYVSTLVEGEAVETQVAVRARDLRAARTGDAYLWMELSDRSGTIPGVMFRPGPDEWSVPLGTVVDVSGRVTSYRGVRRVSIESLRPARSFDRADLLPSCSRQREELAAVFSGLRDGIRHQGLRAVIGHVFDAGGFLEKFAECPGAIRRHHGYVGGLLEHTVSVASLCRVLAGRYEAADEDLLVSAALLHDVGKVDEIRFETSLDQSDAGRLLGHVVLGERIVSAAIAQAGTRLDEQKAMRLLHLIVSHHGERQWGAAVPPACLEAVLLHHADHLDAQASGFTSAIAGAAVLEEPWTDAENCFGRPLYAAV